MNWNWLSRDKLMGMTMGLMLYPVIQQSAPWFMNGILDGLKERATLPMIEQRIEVIRGEAARVRCPGSFADQPVRQQQLDWNSRISHEHESNLVWLRLPWLGWPIPTLADIFSTDQWNRIPLISWPCVGER